MASIEVSDAAAVVAQTTATATQLDMGEVAAMNAPTAPVCGILIPNRIFVGGISRETSEYDLMFVFSAYGTVRSTKIICDHEGVNKGYGFVTFETEEEARRLYALAKCVILNNRRLNIGPAIKRQQVRPMLQRYVDANGRIFFASSLGIGQHRPVASMPFAPTSSGGGGGGGGGGNNLATIYPPGVQYQPVYQYFSVPMKVPSAWPHNYFQEPQSASVPLQANPGQQVAWGYDAVHPNPSNMNGGFNNWRPS